MGENLCAKNTVCATIDLGHFSIDINEQKKKIPSQNSLAILCHTKVCAQKKNTLEKQFIEMQGLKKINSCACFF